MWKQRIAGFVVAAALTFGPLLASGHYMYPDAMTAEQIRTTIIGNTMTGALADGTVYTEYYDPDGTIRGTDSVNGPYAGRWSIRADDVMCWAYAPDYAIIGCVLLTIDGDTVNFQQIGGHTEPPAKLMTGNPSNL